MDESSGPILVFNMTMDQVLVPHLDLEAQMASANRSSSVIASELAALWRAEAFMDVELYCTGNVVVRAHKLVLAAISPLFRQLFLDLGPFLEVDYAIVLADVEADVLRDFLEKLYSGCQNSAVIDSNIDHLKFTGEPFKGNDRDDLKELIKDEPFDDLVNDNLESEEEEEEEVEEKQPVKKAKIWQFFEVVSKDVASCLMCQAAIKTQKGCTSSMTRHVSRFHPDALDEPFEAKEEPTDDPDFSFEDPNSKLKKSKVWNFFERVEKDIAKCKTCSVVIKTQKGNTSGMSRHLFRAHVDIYSQLEAMREKETIDSDESSEDDDNFSPFKGLSFKQPKKKKGGVNTRKRSNQKRSKVWQFFTQQSDGSEAKCNNCDMAIKTDMGNTSGLISHLRSSHPEEFESLNSQKDPTKFATSGARNSPVWRYYSELGSNRVKCNKCETVLKYYYGTTSGLLRHLRRTHPEEYESIKNEESARSGESFSEVAMNAASVDSETIWKYFHLEGDKANCVDCMAEISNDHENLVTSCEEHLRASHTDLLEQYESQRKALVQDLIKTDKTAIKRRYTSRVVASAIWSYFKKTEDAALNQCLTCLVEIDCSQNSTAMVKHLEDAHPDQHDAFKKTSGIEAKDIKKPSAIWNHFETTSDPKKHKCLACGKEILCHYQTTSNMIRHLEHNHTDLYEVFIRESHGLEQTEDVLPLIKKPKKRNLNQKGPVSDSSDRTCPDCGKEYSCRPAMLFHYKCVHSGIRPYKCEECGMTFARQDSWKGHTHSKLRSFLCSICGKTFARRNIRDTHERAHLNDRRYPCSFGNCGKKFMTNQQRTNHERTHTGEKPFQCTDCGRQFAQQHQLTTHTRIHTGEKPYACQHCGQKFRHLSSRNNHKCDNKPNAAVVVAGQVADPASLAQISVSWSG